MTSTIQVPFYTLLLHILYSCQSFSQLHNSCLTSKTPYKLS